MVFKKAFLRLWRTISKSSDLCSDSRTATSICAFFAMPGRARDGKEFIAQAITKGARIIISQSPINALKLPKDRAAIYFPNVKQLLKYCSDKMYGWRLPQNLIAVTGTNGKTSTAYYYAQILSLLGQKAASIGTLGMYAPLLPKLDTEIEKLCLLTSNDVVSNYKLLSYLKDQQVENVAMEASSIGIEQERFGHIKFSSAAFVSFGKDHLDYHENLSQYLKAKLKLFKMHLKPGAKIFIPLETLAQIKNIAPKQVHSAFLKRKVCTIGEGSKADINLNLSNLNDGKVSFTYKKREYEFSTRIRITSQLYNLMHAIFLVHSCGEQLDQILQVIPKVQLPPGRMQKVPNIEFDVFIDYAHDASSLGMALSELRALCPTSISKIFCVFGCGGDRDKTKRVEMGSVSGEKADYVVVCDDNPRHEDPAQIRREIIQGLKGYNYTEIGDRIAAIRHALSLMSNRDVLLIAGKGHEQFQLYGDKKLPMDDLQTVIQYFKT